VYLAMLWEKESAGRAATPAGADRVATRPFEAAQPVTLVQAPRNPASRIMKQSRRAPLMRRPVRRVHVLARWMGMRSQRRGVWS